MNYRLLTAALALTAATVLSPFIAQSAEPEYAVIVHKQSPVNSISRALLNDVYTKKVTHWKNGLQVEPVDLTATNPLRSRFTQDVLGKNVQAVQAYWRKAIFAGQAVPPIELQHDGDILNYVSNHQGAIGYIAATTYTEAAYVRKVKVTD